MKVKKKKKLKMKNQANKKNKLINKKKQNLYLMT